MKIKPVEEIKALCEKYAAPLGLTVAETEFKQGKNPTLTVFIDKEGGVSLDDCEALHNAIFDPLDELDPTFGLPYTLNVSSLGADRPFKTEKDFLSHIGKKVEIKLYAAVKGKKFYEGELLEYDGERIVVKTDAKTVLSLELKSVVKVSEYIDFN
ncbi:MAG: ribosome maturation factor RimP [Clostridia bacterium]|nr:ribosome maturation factor RimP [Clostridia bacterium]